MNIEEKKIHVVRQRYFQPETRRNQINWSAQIASPPCAVHLWIAWNGSETPTESADFYGGVEYHRSWPDEYDTSPSRQHCEFIGCPCYHDGSSLQADRWISRFKSDGIAGVEDSVWIFLRARVRELADKYEQRAAQIAENGKEQP